MSPDRNWWGVLISQDIVDSGAAWVSADYVVTNNEVANVPVIQPPDPPPAATPNPTATSESPPPGETVMATTTEVMNVFSGPGKDYESYGKIEKGAQAEALGKSADGAWIQLALPDISPDGRGWVNANYVILEPANAELPVVPAP